MPSIGIGEILLIALVALFVVGPERLPSTVRQIGLFLHNLKQNAKVLSQDVLGRENEPK